MKIVYSHAALKDLEEIHSYISADSPTNAAKVVWGIRKSVQRLEMFPKTGRAGLTPGSYDLVIPQLPFVVVFSVTETVNIIAVFHTAQDR